MVPPTLERATRLLRFAAPGFLHQIGNAVFRVQARAQLLGPGRDPMIARDAIVSACEDSRGSMDIYRLLVEPIAVKHAAVLGPLIDHLLGILRVGMRDSGLGLAIDDDVAALVQTVNDRQSVLAVTEACFSICEALPTGFVGRLWVSVDRAGRAAPGICFQVQHGPSRLRFAVDSEGAVERSAAILGVGGAATPLGKGRGLMLHFPEFDSADRGANPRAELGAELGAELKGARSSVVDKASDDGAAAS